jgi:hypothetical protein
MISDVLFDAIEEIERHQKFSPQCYNELREEIDAVKEAMRALQIKLDSYPPPISSRAPSL